MTESTWIFYFRDDELYEKDEKKNNWMHRPLLIFKSILCFKYYLLWRVLSPFFVFHMLSSTIFCTHAYVRVQLRDCICTHVHIDACVYSFDKVATQHHTRETNTYLSIRGTIFGDQYIERCFHRAYVFKLWAQLTFCGKDFRQESLMRRNGGRYEKCIVFVQISLLILIFF